MKAPSTGPHSTLPSGCDVLVVGGGPIGLLLACLLGRQNIRTILVERRFDLPDESMAIGVTPPSLDILQNVALDKIFSDEGLKVVTAKVHEGMSLLGELDFSGIPSNYPFWLSIPQSKTVELLWNRVQHYPSVSCFRGVEFRGFCRTDADGAEVELYDLRSARQIRLNAAFVAGCDGHRSKVREAAGIKSREKQYPQRFIMADFSDDSGLGKEAHLFFSSTASVESFPLPGAQRRWIVLAPECEPVNPLDYLVETVQNVSGWDLTKSRHSFLSTFGAKRTEVSSYFKGRVALCGDASHTMSSIGGQGMNTGFADAEMLSVVLKKLLQDSSRSNELFKEYDCIRRKACKVAADRASSGMWFGTHRGRLFSIFRKWFIRRVLFSSILKDKLAPYFAMLTIPNNTLANTPGFCLEEAQSS